MAEQILQISASSFLNGSYGGISAVGFLIGSSEQPQVATELTGGVTRYLQAAFARIDGRVALRFADSPSNELAGDGDDLSSAFEATGSITWVIGGSTLTVLLAGDDPTEPYLWMPANSVEVIAFHDTLDGFVTGSDLPGTLTIRDFPPVVPSWTDNTGNDITGMVGTAIADVTVPAVDAGTPDPTYAAVGALPAGVSFDPTTRVLSFTTADIEAGSGTITIRATNSAGMDDWTVAYTFIAPDLSLDAAFTGGLDGTLAPAIALGQIPLTLADILVPDGRVLVGTGSLIEAGANEPYGDSSTVIAGDDPPSLGSDQLNPTRMWMAAGGTRWRISDNGTGDIEALYSADGALENYQVHIQTTPTVVVTLARDAIFATASNEARILWDMPDADEDILNAIGDGDRWLFFLTEPAVSLIDAVFQGGLDGTLAPGVQLGEAPDLDVNTAFQGNLDGTLAPGVALGPAPGVLVVDAVFQGGLLGMLAPGVALGQVSFLSLDAAFVGGLVGTLTPAVRLAPLPVSVGAVFLGGLDGTLVPRVQRAPAPALAVGAVFLGGLDGTLVPRVFIAERTFDWPAALPRQFLREGFSIRPR